MQEDIDFVSAHGTATPLNDAMEAKAIHRVLGENARIASLKPYTGHTLAGAGALQAAFAWLLLTDNPEGRLFVNQTGSTKDPTLARGNPGKTRAAPESRHGKRICFRRLQRRTPF